MSDHLLTVTRGPDHFDDQDDFEFNITCVTPDKCEGWLECRGDHTGFENASQRTDSVVIHGELHTWQSGHGFWSVPYSGCIVQWGLDENSGQESAWDVASTHGLGTHEVDVDWDDFGMVLHHIPSLEGVRA